MNTLSSFLSYHDQVVPEKQLADAHFMTIEPIHAVPYGRPASNYMQLEGIL
jgi:hypothetical protein